MSKGGSTMAARIFPVTGPRLLSARALVFLTTVFFVLSFDTISFGKDIDFPKRPITMVVPFSAGGATDIQARLVAGYWKKVLGQPIAVENKPGGGGAIGLREVLRARADGYTIGCGMFPDSIIQVALKGTEAGFRNEDFLLLGSYSNNPGALMVMKNGPFKTIKDFIAYAKAHPGKLTVSISSPTWMLHLIEFEDKAGIHLNSIMFKGGGEQINALLGGHVMASMGGSHFAVTGRDKGIVALAVTSQRRIEGLPETPTMKQSGYDIAYDVRRFFFVPAATPKPVVEKLTATLRELDKDKEFAAKVKASGEEYDPLLGQDLEKYYRGMIVRITDKVKKDVKRFSE